MATTVTPDTADDLVQQLRSMIHDLSQRRSPREARAALNTVDAAEYIGFGASTMRRWRMEGIGPNYVKHGSVVVYRICDLDSWLMENLIDR